MVNLSKVSKDGSFITNFGDGVYIAYLVTKAFQNFGHIIYNLSRIAFVLCDSQQFKVCKSAIILQLMTWLRLAYSWFAMTISKI